MKRVPGVVWGTILLLALAYFLFPNPGPGLIEAFAVIPARYTVPGYGFSRPLEALGPLFGHVFFHGGLFHLGANLLVFLQVAPQAVRRISVAGGGLWRFLALFFGSAGAAAAAYVLINPVSTDPAIGASGAVCGVFAGFLLAQTRRVRDAIRDRGVLTMGFWFLAINVGLAAAARYSGFLPIAWEAHLGGFLGGLVLYPLLAPRQAPGPWDHAP